MNCQPQFAGEISLYSIMNFLTPLMAPDRCHVYIDHENAVVPNILYNLRKESIQSVYGKVIHLLDICEISV